MKAVVAVCVVAVAALCVSDAAASPQLALQPALRLSRAVRGGAAADRGHAAAEVGAPVLSVEDVIKLRTVLYPHIAFGYEVSRNGQQMIQPSTMYKKRFEGPLSFLFLFRFFSPSFVCSLCPLPAVHIMNVHCTAH